MSATFFVIGASHRTWTGSLRDRLFAEPPEIPGLLAELSRAGLPQALWLSTCDRVEVVGSHDHPGEAELLVAAQLARRAGLPEPVLESALYTHSGAAAVRHVFAVASSLDSQLVGEPHVLGQCKDAYRQAVTAGLVGAELDALMQAAFAVAKRVRSETALAERPTSIAAAAVDVARELHGALGKRSGLLIGLGDMGELMADQLAEAGLARFTVTAPVDARAEAAARRRGCHYAPFAMLEEALAGADVVVSAVGLGRTMLGPALVEAALRRRRRRPVFVIDAALPTDVDPAVGALDGAFVYDLADLERMAVAGRVSREAAAAAAWGLVEAAVAEFLRGRAERAAVPAVVALRRHFELERRRLLADTSGLDAAEATRLLINRLLHGPSEALRRLASESGHGPAEQARAEWLLQQLFGLELSAGEDRET